MDAASCNGFMKSSHQQPSGAENSAPAKLSTCVSTQKMDPLLASMLPDELRLAMDALGYQTQSALAGAIGVDRSTVSLWLDGRIGVPRPVGKLVRMLLLHDANSGPHR